MKKCLRLKCQKEFEPNKPKQVFCSAKCRVYNSRETKIPEIKFIKPTTKSYNGERSNRFIQDEPSQWMMPDKDFPTRKEGESGLDYKIRCAEYLENKKKQD